MTYLDCPCCGGAGAESADGLFREGDPLICGCDGFVSIDDGDADPARHEAYVYADDCECGGGE